MTRRKQQQQQLSLVSSVWSLNNRFAAIGALEQNCADKILTWLHHRRSDERLKDIKSGKDRDQG